MEMAALSSKKVTYIYNRFEPCCFADPEATRFKNDFHTYDIRLVSNAKHDFDPNYILNELTK
jgi:hypothetical protein